jgi:hypothetical protein
MPGGVLKAYVGGGTICRSVAGASPGVDGGYDVVDARRGHLSRMGGCARVGRVEVNDQWG